MLEVKEEQDPSPLHLKPSRVLCGSQARRSLFCSSFPLPSPSSEASRRSPERPRRAAPGLGQAAVRADCVSQKRVPPRSGGPGQSPAVRLVGSGPAPARRGRTGSGPPRDAAQSSRREGAAGPGLRVPPAASLVLSRLGRGEVKGWRGLGRGVGSGAVAGRLRVASILPPSGAGGQTGTMWRPKLSA